jgi:hypothetical protein
MNSEDRFVLVNKETGLLESIIPKTYAAAHRILTTEHFIAELKPFHTTHLRENGTVKCTNFQRGEHKTKNLKKVTCLLCKLHR